MKKQKQVQLKVNWSSPRKSITQVSCGLEMPSTFVTKKRNLSMSKIWKVKVILPIIVTVATPHDKKSDNAQNQNRTMQRMRMVSALHSASFSQILSGDDQGDLPMTHFCATIFSS